VKSKTGKLVAVYRFKHLDADHNRDITAPRMATREAIARAHGTVVEASEKLVDESELDGNGFYPLNGPRI
jgi:hypothetical protein